MSNLTFIFHLGDGSTKSFPIAAAGETLGYFRAEDIHGYVDGAEVPTFIEPTSPHLLLFVTAPPAGSEVLVRRIMPVEKPYADFERGNNFGPRQVNNTFLQQLYLTQELLDGFLPDGYYLKQDMNAGGYRITNLGDAQEPDDAVNKKVTDQITSRVEAIEDSMPVGSGAYIVPFYYEAVGGETEVETFRPFTYCRLSINGINQAPNKAFSFLNGKIYFAEPLEEDDVVHAELGSPDVMTILQPLTDARLIATEGQYQFTINPATDLRVYLNGIRQSPIHSFTWVGTTLILAEPLTEGDVVDIEYMPA